MRYKNLFGILFGIFLVSITIYFLLDTFVIVHSYQVIEDTEVVTDTQSVDSSNTSETSEEAVVTDTSYEDKNIKITIETIVEYDTTVYIADVQVSSIEYLQTAFANNSYGRNIKATTSTMAEDSNAILAINGDYYGFRNNGFVLRNGVIYRSISRSGSNDDLVIYDDGSFEVVDESSSSLEELLGNGALQVFSFGPGLVVDGEIAVDTSSEVSQSMTSNPRTAIGMVDELHYIFVVSDGRTDESAGLSLYELAKIMESYDCDVAYNLDGGGSSTMVFNGVVINNPTDGRSDGERSVSDIVYVGY